MRKLLIVAVGLVTWLTALPLYAVDVNFSGEVRVRSFWTDNLTDGNSGGGANEDMARFDDLRFRLKTSIKAGVSTGVVVLDFGNCFVASDASTFNNGVGTAGTTGDCRFGSGGLGHSFGTVGVREAYLHIDLKKVGFILGRQTLKLGHGIVFDDTADAITVVLPLGGATVTASMLQISDTTDALGLTAGINNDTTVWLVNVGMDHGSHIVNIYDALLYDQSPAFTTLNSFYPTTLGGALLLQPWMATVDKLWVNFIGVSVDAGQGPLKLAFEGNYAYGAAGATAVRSARLSGWNLMGDATADAGGAKIGGTVVYTSGQDLTAVGDANVTDISGNFQLGNILLNNEQVSDRDGGSLGGGFTGAGLIAVKLHADVMPTEKLDVGGALIYAQTREAWCVGCSRHVGYELDANAKYKVDDNLAFSAGAGYLLTAGGARDFYSGVGGPANSNLWKLSAKAVFTF
jgi:hypothetical protein